MASSFASHSGRSLSSDGCRPVDSVSCTTRLHDRYYGGDRQWTIEQGSILDPDYVRKLGSFDVVYSWGVLHHTGAMHDALDAATRSCGEFLIDVLLKLRGTIPFAFRSFGSRFHAREFIFFRD